MKTLTVTALACLTAFSNLAASSSAGGNLAGKAEVTVDSCYQGYDPAVLIDGFQLVATEDFTKSGWASSEQAQPHWISLRWQKPVEISSVIVYWALDGGIFRTSQQYEIQSWQDNTWHSVARRSETDNVPFSLCQFSPVTTGMLRIFQSAGEGVLGRTNLMWVAEVEAYGRSNAAEAGAAGSSKKSLTLKPGQHHVQISVCGAEKNGFCKILLDNRQLGQIAALSGQHTTANLEFLVTGQEKQLVVEGAAGAAVTELRTTIHQPATAAMLTKLKPLCLETVLVKDGQPVAVIVPPEENDPAPLINELQTALFAATGVKLPVKTPDEIPEKDLAQHTVIAIGNALNNAVIGRLYGMRLVLADKAYPGKNGYAVRTVHNPLGGGHNIVVAAGSDPSGTRLAVSRLIEHFANARPGVLPRILDLKLGAPQKSSPGPTPESVKRRVEGYIRLRNSGDQREWALNNFAHYGLSYNKYGDLAWAKAYKEMMFTLINWCDENGGVWPMEWLWDPMAAWEVCEEAPCFTDAERLTITNFLLAVARKDRQAYAGSLLARNRIAHGHQLDQHLCVFLLADYFWKYYRLPEAAEWLEITRARLKSASDLPRLQHDSADYNSAGFSFIMRYGMHSGDLTYVTEGNLRKFAELELMCHDNMNWRAEFGDCHNPMTGPRTDVLSYAAWFYGDGKYKWPIRSHSLDRTSVYANDIPPVLPVDHIGVRVFPVETLYYEYLTGHKVDPVAELPHGIVPFEKCYDKLVFREGYEPRDQYLMLDGLSRGEHSHYDGNSVIRFSDNGHIWLFDLDYIRKAPKWHNSLIVIKDGQTRQQSPICALNVREDTGGFGFVQSTMPDYAGVDWQRNIIWRKGEWFVFVDQLIAREPGPYRFKLLWRSVGNTAIDGSDYCVTQKEEITPLDGVTLDQDRDGNGIPDGFQASLTNMKSEKKASMELDHTVFHSAPASLRLTVEPDGYAVVYIKVPVKAGEKYRYVTFVRTTLQGEACASNNGYVSNAEGKRFTGAAGSLSGKHATGTNDWQKWEVEFTAPQDAAYVEPCVRVNCQNGGSGTAWFDDMKLIHLDSNGMETVIFPVDEPQEENGSHMHIVNASGASLLVTSFLQRGHGGKDGYFAAYPYAEPYVKTLQQVADARLQKDDTTSYMNLVYCSDTQQRMKAHLWPVTSTACMVEQEDTLTLTAVRPAGKTGSWRVGNLTFDAEIAAIGTNDVQFTANGSASLAGTPLERGNPGAARDKIEKELRHILMVARNDGVLRQHLPHFETRGLQLVREGAVPGALTSLDAGNLDGDRELELAVGDEAGNVAVFDNDGTQLWSNNCGRKINALECADVDGDGTTELLAGGDDERLHLYRNTGEEVWSHSFERYHSRDGKVVTMGVGSVEGQAGKLIVVGTEAWHYYGINADGDQLWRTGHAHAATVSAVGDIDGDGNPEIIAGTEYYNSSVLDHEGRRITGKSGGPGLAACAMADITGDNQLEMLMALGDSTLSACDNKGRQLWETSLGDEATCLIGHDLDGDGRKEVIVASESLYLYAFDGAGKRLWMLDAGEIITDLAPLPNGRLAAASRGGTVHVVGPDGKFSGHYVTNSPVRTVIWDGQCIVAGCANGRILYLKTL